MSVKDYIHPGWYDWYTRRQVRKFNREVEREYERTRVRKAPGWLAKTVGSKTKIEGTFGFGELHGNRRPLHAALYAGNGKIISGNTEPTATRELPYRPLNLTQTFAGVIDTPPHAIGRYTLADTTLFSGGYMFTYQRDDRETIKGRIYRGDLDYYLLTVTIDGRQYGVKVTTPQIAMNYLKDWITDEHSRPAAT
jgi:hypothetical protein